jgi:hypothetical protein
MMYIIPDYVVSAMNATQLFPLTLNDTPTHYYSPIIANANTQLGLVRGAGFAVVVIAVIWMIISVVAGGGKSGRER